MTKIVTHKGLGSTTSDVDNEIVCMHSSKISDHVQTVCWTANHLNPADTLTPAKFKGLCLKYVIKLGCDAPKELFIHVDPAKDQFLETTEATFMLQRIQDDHDGYGWQFTIIGKNRRKQGAGPNSRTSPK